MNEVPAMIRCHRLQTIRNERALRRSYLSDHFHKLRKRIPFDIELDAIMVGEKLGELIDVFRTNMSLIRPRMHSDAVRTRLDAAERSPLHARYSNVPRVSQ